MSGKFKLTCFILKPLAALLRRVRQTFVNSPEEDQLDHSIISISASRLHF
jgi:hypothetical protein